MPHTYSYIRTWPGLVVLAHAEQAFGQVWHLPAGRRSRPRVRGEDLRRGRLSAEAQVLPEWLLRVLGLFNPLLAEVRRCCTIPGPFILDYTKS